MSYLCVFPDFHPGAAAYHVVMHYQETCNSENRRKHKKQDDHIHLRRDEAGSLDTAENIVAVRETAESSSKSAMKVMAK